MDADSSAAVPLSSPAAAQWGAKGAGLDGGVAAAAQSVMPSIALPFLSRSRQFRHSCRTPGASVQVAHLRQIDGPSREVLASLRGRRYGRHM